MASDPRAVVPAGVLHPLRWFLLAALVYGAWGVYVSQFFAA